ncbi:hypothetical protein [Streptomyces sp. NPDC001635]
MTLNDQTPRERNPFLEAVGRVTIAGTELDMSLRHLLSTITRESTLIHYANAAGTDKLLQLCRLALTAGPVAPEDVPAIAACLDRANRIRERRNRIVHSLFLPTDSDDGINAWKPQSRSIGYTATPVTVEEMEDLADEVTVLRDDLFRAGWNAGPGKDPGMGPIPPRTPGQRVNGVLPKE